MQMQFLGAAHEVTGSQTLLSVAGSYVLVDCGMEQGANIYENAPLPIAPPEIDAVFLTHAHIDHAGNLPLLYKQGFRGAVFCTEATADLCEIMLRDAAHIQESEAEWRARKAERARETAPEPLYTLQHAEGILKCFRRCAEDVDIAIRPFVHAYFQDVGHLLGAACITLTLFEGKESRRIVFSGDIGNSERPILRDPLPPPSADYVVIESTYGDRLHGARPNYTVELADCLRHAFSRGGNVVIPCFAVGRMQEMLYLLREIKNKHLVPDFPNFPVYVDSPLANQATGIFLQCDTKYFDAETRALIQAGENPIWFENLHTSVSAEESKAINVEKTPKVILSASGMCEAGRIRHHLKHNLWRPASIILFVGYQAEGTVGRALISGAKSIKLFGESIGVAAQIHVLAGVSGHADCAGLLQWIQAMPNKPQQVFVNHGETKSCEGFAQLLCEQGYQAYAPYSGAVYDLLRGVFLEQPAGVYRERNKATSRKPKEDNLQTTLHVAAQRLLQLVTSMRNRSNAERRKVISEIEQICEAIEREK